MAADSDSQVPIFLERIRALFRSSPGADPHSDDPQQGLAVAVCVLLSCVLWLSLTLQEQRMVSVEFPVEIGAVPEDQALAERPPSTVTVQLQGTGMDLLGLVFNPPQITLAAEEGEIAVDEVVNLPQASDAQVANVSPRVIRLELEPKIERKIPVRGRYDLELAPAHELIDEPILQPDSITVGGAESIVEGIDAWSTDSLVVTDVRDTVRTEVGLRDSLTSLVEKSTDRVSVTIRAGQFAEETRKVSVEVTGVPSGQDLVALEPSTIRIRYRVLFDQLFESRRSSEFFATVSYDQIRSDTTGYVTPNIHVPSNLVIRDPEPLPPRLQYYTFLSDE